MSYPRKCEVWMDIETGAGIIVPADSAQNILKSFEQSQISLVEQFVAEDRKDMMQKYFDAMGWGTYKTRAEIKTGDTSKATHYSSSGSTTTSTSSSSTTKESAYLTIKKALEEYPDIATKHRRLRALAIELQDG